MTTKRRKYTPEFGVNKTKVKVISWRLDGKIFLVGSSVSFFVSVETSDKIHLAYFFGNKLEFTERMIH